MVAPKKSHSLLETLLAEQQRLDTPVARFSGAHDRGASPAMEPVYRDLIPLSIPRPGEQYAFEVALDSCTGCKACVSACHSLNGLEETETWRDIGLIVGGTFQAPFQQTVTTACHHCADPACLNGCPVLAYEKDPVTGIVRHLDDQCIGCQYCVLKCPYDVPKYSQRLGIVRKCDMCHGRLAEGEAPACVQACPTHAIRIVTVPSQSIHPAPAETSDFLPSAPDPAYTQPTTRYVSQRTQPSNLEAADAATLRPQPAHWPLVFMLTLMPMAVGCFVVGAIVGHANPAMLDPWLIRVGWLAGGLGLAASVFHLGQPLRAWRIFLGWRKSWLSREAIVLGHWFAVASAALIYPRLVPAAAMLGAIGLACSIMIYVDTRRQFWRLAQTAPRFTGSVLILGSATALALQPPNANFALALTVTLVATTLLKLALEVRDLKTLDHDDESPTPGRQTARLLNGPFRSFLGLRLVAGVLGGMIFPTMVATGGLPAGATWWTLGLCLGGELAERYLFFRVVDAPKMPGVPS